MLKQLKEQVCAANLDLVAKGLVIETWGNASAVDRDSGNLVIKPSGVPYDRLRPKHMVVVDLATGRIVEGTLRPSSDTPTHLVLYQAFAKIGGVIHTHSLHATAWAQARRSLPALGTTHADYFHGEVPCTRLLTTQEIEEDYEANTGSVIAETFHRRNPLHCPGVLVASHGPFAWGKSVESAVENAFVLEHLAKLASASLQLERNLRPMQPALLDKHFFRKHGPDAYYGQARPGPTRRKPGDD